MKRASLLVALLLSACASNASVPDNPFSPFTSSAQPTIGCTPLLTKYSENSSAPNRLLASHSAIAGISCFTHNRARSSTCSALCSSE